MPTSGPRDTFGLAESAARSTFRAAAAGLRVPKASDVLADALRDDILAGALAEGSPMLPERDLAAAYGLSRTAVREALRMLEREGLIVTRPGRGGGSFVRRPDAETMNRSLGLFITARRISFRNLLDVREALEPAAAELAALRRTEDDIADLRRVHAQMETSFERLDEFQLRNMEWHITVVRASHNDLMHALMLAVSKQIRQGTPIEGFHSEAIREQVLAVHAKVNEALIDGSPSAARQAMERHLHSYRSAVEKRLPLDEVAST
jgi:GntR family transcriptional regulator, transcriptional repressor for pyruvate dehydrogenase complex